MFLIYKPYFTVIFRHYDPKYIYYITLKVLSYFLFLLNYFQNDKSKI